MKNKLLNIFILVLSFFAFVFVITSCDNNSSTNSNPSTNSDNSVNPGTTDDSSTKTDEQVNTGDDDNVYYTITWKNYDGEVIKTETVKYGTNPIYNGDTPMRPSDQENRYVFLKWDKFFSPVTSDVEYTAVFMAIPYSNCLVKFDSKGGSEVTPQNIIKGEKVTKPSNPTKEGYTFDDWYYQGEKWSFNGYTVTEDMTLEAKWNINFYNLNLNVNNFKAGTISNNSGTHYYNEYITITATTNPGYTFNGWYEGDNLISIKEKYSFTMPLKGLSYTAKWSANTNTPYKVEHYKQNSDGTYPTIPNDVDNLTGETNALIYAYAKAYEGFILPTAKPAYINGDGSTLIKLYYERKSYEISVTNNYSAGEIVGIGTHKYGEKVNIEITPYMGYEYEGIYIDNNFITKELSYEIDSISSNVEIRFKVLKDLENFTFESTKDTLKITGIKDKTVKSIKIPNGVTSIGNGAFSGCTSLASIEIPNSVTSIGYRAFQGCSSLTNITIPNSVTSIGNYAFYECSSLTSITLPFVGESSTTNTFLGYIFGASSYYGNSNYVPSLLKEVIISEGCTSIGSEAFYNCSSITNITIPNSVTSIGNSAFYKCSSITNITIPNSVTSIGNSAFYNNSIETATIPAIACSYIKNSKLKTVVVTSGESIEQAGFSYCTSLTSITIPNSVTSIGSEAFYNCSSLSNIIIPNSVTSIGYSAFGGCSSITNITIPFIGENVTNNTYLGYIFGAESYSKSSNYVPTLLKKVIISEGCTSIGDKAFYECSSLTSIELPSTVASIGDEAFFGCASLISIIVDSNNKIYDSRNNCNAIIATSTNELLIGCIGTIIPDSVTSIGSSAFSNCSSLTSITIPSSVTSIGNKAFYRCTSLTNIEIPNSVANIGTSAFSGCSKLESMTLPFVGENVTNNTYLGYIFGAESYSNSSTCIPTSLKEVIISEGCISIGTYAFYNCKSLTSITIPDSVTTIGQSAFFGCSKLESITLPFIGSNRYTPTDTYQVPLGYIFGTKTYPDGLKTEQYYYGPSTSSRINNYYYIPSTLKEVILTDCEYIQYGAFYNCRLIENVILKNVKSIGSYSFYGCKSLTNITIPNSVTSIGEYAFSGCSSLTSITIPNSVTNIGNYAFGDTFILDVYYDGKIEDWCNILFNGDSNLMHKFEISNKFYLLDKNGDVAHNNKKYSQLTELVIPNTVKTIGSYQFDGFVQLKSITIPDSVTSIGNYAFYDCRSLTSVAISNNVTSIGKNAFSGCSSLTSITIPNSVTSIGDNAFDCYKLVEVINKSSLNITTGSSDYGNIAYHAKQVISDESESKLSTDKDGFVTYNDGIDIWLVNYIGNDKDIVIPNNVTKINDYAFVLNSFTTSPFLTSVTISNNVTSIGENAFNSCLSLTSVTIPSSVTSIGNGAFDNCLKLVEVINESSLNITKGSSDYGNIAYYAKQVISDKSESKLSTDKDGFITYNDGTDIWLVNYIGNDKDIVIPNNVTKINDYAFILNSSLSSIIITNNVTSIENYTFDGCISLTSVTIPNRPSIGNGAFNECISLANVYYDGAQEEWSLIKIGNNNSKLTSATRYYYSEIKPSQNGNYWHYIDGEIVVWE